MRGKFYRGYFQLDGYELPGYGGPTHVLIVRSSIRVACSVDPAPLYRGRQRRILSAERDIESYLATCGELSGERAVAFEGLWVHGQKNWREYRVDRKPFTPEERMAITIACLGWGTTPVWVGEEE
jgi:hypothetical protein